MAQEDRHRSGMISNTGSTKVKPCHIELPFGGIRGRTVAMLIGACKYCYCWRSECDMMSRAMNYALAVLAQSKMLD